jgi:hypothetical protein
MAAKQRKQPTLEHRVSKLNALQLAAVANESEAGRAAVEVEIKRRVGKHERKIRDMAGLTI